MKATKFIKRERRTPERATGSLVCHLSFPETDEQYDIRPLGNTKTIFGRVRNFLSHHLKERHLQLEGAIFTISAEVRSIQGGIRRKPLVIWQNGDSIDEAVKSCPKTMGISRIRRRLRKL